MSEVAAPAAIPAMAGFVILARPDRQAGRAATVGEPEREARLPIAGWGQPSQVSWKLPHRTAPW